MFSYNEPYGATCVFLNGEGIAADSNQSLLNDKDQQVFIMGCVSGRSLLSRIAL